MAEGKLQSLQAGRAAAALAVLVYHAAMSSTSFVGGGPGWAPLLNSGAAGVDFFFVLSGFIIYWTYGDRDNSLRLALYVRRRIERIFVPYLPVGIAMAIAYSVLPSLGQAPHHWTWLTTVTLLPTGSLPALLPAWTLMHEMVFYVIMGLLLVTRRVGLGLTIWAAALLLLRLPSGTDSSAILATMNLEFVFGAAAAWCVRRAAPSILFLAAATVPAVALVSTGVHMGSLVFGALIALLLVPIVRRDLAGLLRVPRWTSELGEASYSLYLVHLPVCSLVARGVGAVWPGNWGAGVVACILSGLAAGLAYHQGFERPALDWLKRRRDQGPSAIFVTRTNQSPEARSMVPPVSF